MLLKIFTVATGIAVLSYIPAIITDMDLLIGLSVFLTFLSLGPLLVLVLTHHPGNKKGIRNTLILAGLMVIALTAGIILNSKESLIVIPAFILLLCLGLLHAIPDRGVLARNLILVSLMVLGFFFKRQHWPFAGVILSFSIGILSSGFFFYAVRLLFTVKNNRYLKWTGFVCSLLVATALMSILFKFQHWPFAGILMQASLIPLILMTIIVLLTLPNSGFISWTDEHKKVLTRRMLVPWVFILVFIALNLLLPVNVRKNIFEADVSREEPFNMVDYPVRSDRLPEEAQ